MATVQGKRKRGRYPIKLGDGSVKHYISVTTALDIVAKPGLINWAGKLNMDCMLASAGRVYSHIKKADESGSDVLPGLSEFIRRVKEDFGAGTADKQVLRSSGDVGSEVHRRVEKYCRRMLTVDLEQIAMPFVDDKFTPDQQNQIAMAYNNAVQFIDDYEVKPEYIEEIVYSEDEEYAGTLDLIAETKEGRFCIDWKSGNSIYPEYLTQCVAYKNAAFEMGLGPCDGVMVVRLKKDEEGYEVRKLTDLLEMQRRSRFFRAASLLHHLYSEVK